MSRRTLRLVVLVAALTFAAVAIVVVVWPRSSSAEDRARQQAKDVACNISQVGLGIRPCAPVQNFRKTGPDAWRFRIEGPARGEYHCFEVKTKTVGALQPLKLLSCR